MGTTTDKLNKLIQTKAAIKGAIEQKGGTLAANAPFADYADAITNLPSGGSNNLIADLLAGNTPTIDIDLRGMTSNPSGVNYIFDNAPSQESLYRESLLAKGNKNINYWSPGATDGASYFIGLNITDGQRHSTNYEQYQYFIINKLTFKQLKARNDDPMSLALPSSGSAWSSTPLVCNTQINSLEIGDIVGTESHSPFLVGISQVHNISITPGATWRVNPFILLSKDLDNPTTLILPALSGDRFRMPMIGGDVSLNNVTLIVPPVSIFYWASAANALTYGPGIIKMLGTTPPSFTYYANYIKGTIFYVPLSAYNDYIVTTGWVNLYNEERVYPMVTEDTTYTINYKDTEGALILSVQGTLAAYEKAEITLAEDSFTDYLHEEVTFSLLNGTSFDVTVYPKRTMTFTVSFQDADGNIIDTETITADVADGMLNNYSLAGVYKEDTSGNYYKYEDITVTTEGETINAVGTVANIVVLEAPAGWEISKEGLTAYDNASSEILNSDDTVVYKCAYNKPRGTSMATYNPTMAATIKVPATSGTFSVYVGKSGPGSSTYAVRSQATIEGTIYISPDQQDTTPVLFGTNSSYRFGNVSINNTARTYTLGFYVNNSVTYSQCTANMYFAVRKSEIGCEDVIIKTI